MRRTIAASVKLVCLVLAIASLFSPATGIPSERKASAAGGRIRQVFLPMLTIGPGHSPVPANAPGPSPTPLPTPLTLGTGSRLGVWLGPAGSETMIQQLRDTGAGWTRFHLEWSAVEPADADPPHYDFGAYDADLAAVGRIGVKPIVEVRSNPSWAATTRCGAIQRLDRFTAFITALVDHYKVAPYNVKHWEFFNEPDNRKVSDSAFVGGCFGDTPQSYVEVLRTAQSAVKAADPEAKVVLGGLAFDGWNDPTFGPVFNLEFLDQILALGAAPYFDVANMHYYSSQGPGWAGFGKDIGGKVSAFRQVIARYTTPKPVVVTETNWTGGGSGDVLEQQARYVPKVLARGLANDLYATYWFMLKEWPGADYPYGLVDLELRPRAAYYAYQIAEAEFGDARSVRPLLPQELDATGGIEGYAFQVANQERWVVWSDGDPVSVRLPSRALEMRDRTGQAVYASGSAGGASFLLSDSPMYLHLTPQG